MLHIMNVAHRGMNKWLIDSGVIKDGDIGCVGGETLQSLAKINHLGC
ncbi:hypothetical protein [Lysinibacillus sphaericus]|uniref:Uncharacterized protein n=1 Tax=Lysinibacillus sphaericus OT4b.31 TaxID=1285586 RepID=R7ZCT4_LYSSH|nr:hypothetical protein [Lysinibacillus sphaericus]EON71908.1 hypothetical protein H131_13228 [Lysinibacillus sphaericus OT4b.31]